MLQRVVHFLMDGVFFFVFFLILAMAKDASKRDGSLWPALRASPVTGANTLPFTLFQSISQMSGGFSLAHAAAYRPRTKNDKIKLLEKISLDRARKIFSVPVAEFFSSDPGTFFMATVSPNLVATVRQDSKI